MVGSDFSLRTATSKDVPQIIALGVETIQSTCKSDYNQEQINAWIQAFQNTEKWAVKLKEQYFLVAEAKAKMVGFASLGNGYYIDYLYVEKNCLRQGIACRLYGALEEKAMSLGEKSLASNVSITAKIFFEEMGFTVGKENRNFIKGIMLINYTMVKVIKPFS